MSSEIEIWGGRPRQGLVRLDPNSEEALNDVKKPFMAYITKFPEFSYATDWGDWDKSNSEWITSKIKTLAGGNDNLVGNIVKMLGGPYYKPPILTDKWTQLAAQLADSYVKFDFELIAFPVIDSGKEGAHVEGLRYDNQNLYNVLTFNGLKLNDMWDWLKLGKTASMPKTKFSTDVLMGNIGAISKNLDPSSENGKLILGGAGAIGEAIGGVFDSSKTYGESAGLAMSGVENILRGLTSSETRLGHTFTLKVYDTNGVPLFDTLAPKNPVDFYITSMEFDFSPHILKIVNANGSKRLGSCPEYCKIKLTLESAALLSPEQIREMCKYGYK